MHYVAFFSLLLSLLIGILGGGISVYFLLVNQGEEIKLSYLELCQKLITATVLLSSFILFYALAVKDFSFSYVHDYTDSFLPLFYRLSAFWAGQDGSFLFWLLCIALLGVFFIFTPTYRENLRDREKILFWVFYFLIEAFFLLMLTGPSNPFLKLDPAPVEGRGLNPLLQNVGMIFHPPLLFLGYAGFTLPACLALAFWLEGRYKDWFRPIRNLTVLAWAFLTIGILLGGWWSYMELGWGGYWAWDPVENASLIPWLFATAYLHLSLISRRKKTLYKTSYALIHLSFLSCIFATFLVRSNVVESLHAFGSTGVGTPLVVFMVIYLGVVILNLFVKVSSKSLDEVWSKSGLLFITSWILIFIGIIIIMGTMWPVISKLWSSSPIGLDAKFYNKVCLPLFVLISIILFFCFLINWQGSLKSKTLSFVAMLLALGSIGLFYFLGYANLLSLLAIGVSIGLIGTVLFNLFKEKLYKNISFLGVYGLHLGLAILVIGVALSGPFKQEKELILSPQKKVAFSNYELHYEDLVQKEEPGIKIFEAKFKLYKQGKYLGELLPQKRLYAHFEQPFVEVDTYPSLGQEVYISLLGFDEDKNVSIKVSLNPAINWVWIGGSILSLFGLLAVFRKQKI